MNLLANLNPVQQEAVTHVGGPLLILAGAGSGKTRILTHRIAYLIGELGVDPFEILAITFTNKAADEMKNRIEALVGPVSRRMWVSTFHSACVRILRREIERLGYTRRFTIYDESDRKRLISSCLGDLDVDPKRFPASKVMVAISNAKNHLIDAETYSESVRTYQERTFAEVYQLYQERLYKNNALDFDDLIMVSVNLFTLFASVREAYQEMFKYILVDEYQDTNEAQYSLINLLAAKHRNLCVVGDDDQCLPAGTLVSTDKGDVPIEKIEKGQNVLTAVGRGGVSVSKVTNVSKTTKTARHITFITKSGARVTATDNHKMFALVPQKSNREHHYVYLMHKQELGWRIGVTNDLEFCHRAYAPKSKNLLKNPQLLHLLSLETSDENTCREIEALGFKLEKAKKGKRLRVTSTDIKKLEEIAYEVAEKTDALPELNFKLGIFNRQSLPALIMPAGNVKEGFWLPISRNDQIFYDEVVEIEEEIKSEPVYDLEVERTHNFIANGVVVHNSIYKFRGADIRNILNFEEDYPDAKVIKLEQNYRSTKTILEAANRIVANNRGRKEKSLWTANDDGEPAVRFEGENEHEEATFVVTEIESLVRNGRTYNDMAVFYRTNAQSRVFEEILLRYGVPYRVIGSLRFYERQEIKDILAYLRVVVNPADSVSIRRIINVPKRGLGKAAVAWVDNFAVKEKVDFWSALRRVDEIVQLTPVARKAVASFVSLIDGLRALLEGDGVNIEEFMRSLIDRTAYVAALEEERTVESQSRVENVQELVSVVQEFEREGERTLDEFLAEVSLISDIDELPEEENAVTLMTLHNAKGLEFPVVFIAGMEDGVFPHIRSVTDMDELEEERRLCYVGITRAQKRLYLTNALSRNLWGGTSWNTPSRFLREIPEELTTRCERKVDAKAIPKVDLDYEVGDRIKHPQFGEGLVTAVSSPGQITVLFSEGEKTLHLSYAPLEKLETRK
ncbi:MAG: UvrD-helicase domain-containing protein [Actinobacteria bacterium]|nr:UvrD-helicase domain-containing protein [Actinomycetota bacterium]